jgi:inner membrane protein
MPTVLTHAAVPLALGLGAGREKISTPLLLMGIAAAVLPDVDALAFRFGVPYASAYGHRGFTHSFVFAALVALVGACVLGRKHLPRALGFLLLAAVSHPILDALTTGGLGVALLWPFSEVRHFAPWRVIQVSPLSLSRLLTHRGFIVASSELCWVWLPCLLMGLLIWILRKNLAPEEQSLDMEIPEDKP